jgi:hypothetical protein
MLVFNAAKTIQQMYEVPELASALKYPISRETGDGDVWDGALLKDWTD